MILMNRVSPSSLTRPGIKTVDGCSVVQSGLKMQSLGTAVLAEEFAFGKRSERPQHSVSNRCSARQVKARLGSEVSIEIDTFCRPAKIGFAPEFQLSMGHPVNFQ